MVRIAADASPSIRGGKRLSLSGPDRSVKVAIIDPTVSMGGYTLQLAVVWNWGV
ncbi:hypothetical protein os4_36600 (plasmid) [Comamonadaceae bacterium OS-4]|nr:hypothetical protein os4_36600 [Comamonadaceae bacterium OS-4]